MSKVSFTFVSSKEKGSVGTLNLYVGGKLRQVREDHVNFKHIRNALAKQDSEDEIVALIENKVVEPEVVKPVAQTLGKVQVTVDGEVFYDGIKVDEPVAERIRSVQVLGLPISGYAAFLEKLYRNIEFRVRTELLGFIERNGLTITDDGYILAYKAVRKDWLDKYSGTISNRVGSTIRMNRDLVDSNYNRGCSKGLHAGALEYVYSYGGGDDRIVIVKIDPENVVSVPSDCLCQKIRTCEYYVLGEYEGELKRGVYDAEQSTREMYDLDRDEDGDDFDWDEVADDYDEDDYDYDEDEDIVEDYFDEGDVEVVSDNDITDGVYGVKPNGSRFHNVRDSRGRFSSK